MVAARKPLTVALEPEDQERLEQLAQEQGGTAEELLRSLALRLLAEEDEDLAELDRRLADLDADGEGIPHDEVEAWLRSRGTDKELPGPKQRRM
jgi:predicted transcriptional regulator